MKQDFEESLSTTKISAKQQQLHATFAPSNLSNENDLYTLIAAFRQEVNDLKEDKENINQNTRNNNPRSRKF